MATKSVTPDESLSDIISQSASAPAPPPDVKEEVSRSLFLFENGELVNVRVLLQNGKMLSHFGRNQRKLLQWIAEFDTEPEVSAIYVQLQVLDPSTLTDLPEGKGVKRHHVCRFRWLVVDVDTLRPDKAKTNATEEEKVNSLQVAMAVSAYLQKHGWPQPILCDSGNGWHLVWKIDLENSQEHHEMLCCCFEALASKFDNEHGEIDCSLAEPEQLIKLWGTMVRKGEDTPLRPWRRSRVVEVPDSVQVVPVELLQSLAAQAPAQVSITHRKKSKYPKLYAEFDPEDFFEWCQENLPEEYQEFFCRDSDADHDEADGHHYVMDGCFWAERKHSGDRKKTEFILGRTFGVKCFSDDCDDIHIGDILRKVTKLAGKPYPGQIWEEDESIFEGVDFIDGDGASANGESESDTNGTGESEDEQVDGTPVDSVEGASASDPLAFPEEAMYGKLAEMATAMNMPLGLAYPALIGTYSVMPDIDEMADTRINTYVILLAAPGGGKNVAIKRALAMVSPPKETYKKSAPVSDRGVMSLVGHRTEKKQGGKKEVTHGPKKLLLVTNEAANVLKKANIKNSSLGATLCELWDENEYAPADRNGEQACDCRLSWVGGLPIKRDHPEEFGEYFGHEAGRGLLSRTILGFSDVKFNYKRWSPPDLWGTDEDGLLNQMAFGRTSDVQVPEACQKMLGEWEPKNEEDAGRLKYIATKVALLTASSNGDKAVGVDCMKSAIEFAKWQERLREVFTIGVAAENSLEAQFTEALLGALKQKGGSAEFIAWKRLAHDRKWVERFGPRIVNTTVDNLIKTGTLEPKKWVEKNAEGEKEVKTDTNKVKLRDWSKR